jgi:hypothetical protein
VAIALLTTGFLLAASIAVYQFVRLRSAEERIEELEAQLAEGGEGDGSGGGLLEGLGDAFDEILEGAEGLLDQGGLGGGLDLLSCLGTGGLPSGEPLRIEGSPEDQVRQVSAAVEDIRELEFARPVEAEFLSPPETAARIRELFLEEYTEEVAEAEERILTALGAIAPGTDLQQTWVDALGAQVAGFYEPETGELVVRTSGQDLSAFDKIALAHELEHALADQRLELPIPEDSIPGQKDSEVASLAVVEGDAVLTQILFAARLPLEEQLIDPPAIADAQAQMTQFPQYLQQEVLFPYTDGLSFVCELFAEGGWEAVNAAYDRPPTTSAEVLFPERYGSGPPADPPDPGSPGQGWRMEGTHQLGAAQLLWLFQAPGNRPGDALSDPLGSVAAWDGGELHLWTRGPDSAVGIALAERPGEEAGLCGAITQWYGAAFENDRETETAGGGLQADGERQDAVIACPGDQVRVGIATDLATARALVG